YIRNKRYSVDIHRIRRPRTRLYRARRWRGSSSRDQASRRPPGSIGRLALSGAASVTAALPQRTTAASMSWPRRSAMVHLRTGVGIEMSMTQIRPPLQPADDREPARTHGDNRPLPVRSLRDWLDHLAARDRLVVGKPGSGLRCHLGAIGQQPWRLGGTGPLPVPSLRDWLDHRAARDLLVVVKPGIGLRFDLAAIAKRLDGLRATVFPRPGGHSIPIVSGLISDRGWMAEAMGVEPGE